MTPPKARNPLVMLTWIESGIIVLGCLVQSVVLALNAPIWGTHSILYACLVTIVAIVSVGFVPHTATRRAIVPTVIAIASLIALAIFPWQGLVMLALLGVFGSRITMAFGARGAIVAWLFAAIAITLRSYEQMAVLDTPLWLFVYSAGTILVLLAVLFSALAMLATALDQVKGYAMRAAQAAALAERSRIALDLHDALGHGLTTLSVQLEAAERFHDLDRQREMALIARARATAAGLLADIRETVSMLRRPGESDECFSAMMHRLFADVEQIEGLDFNWDIRISKEPSSGTAIALFRVAQEALTNVIRHAGATSARVVVACDGGDMTMTIDDNGCGFAEGAAPVGNGLDSIRERVGALGGTLRIESRERAGTLVSVTVPIAP
jgi:signal transduction histidine kinase